MTAERDFSKHIRKGIVDAQSFDRLPIIMKEQVADKITKMPIADKRPVERSSMALPMSTKTMENIIQKSSFPRGSKQNEEINQKHKQNTPENDITMLKTYL